MPQAAPYPLVFLGSLELAAHCLKALSDSPLFCVKAVITRESAEAAPGKRPVIAEAMARRIAVYNFDSFLRGPSAKLLQSQRLIAVAVSYGRILPPDFLKHFPKKAFNIHPSLLPLYRGAAPIERALMAGEAESGVSLQLISEKLDAGDLIGQARFPISIRDTAGEVYEKAKGGAVSLLLKDLPLFLKGEREARPQAHAEGAPYAAKIQKEECRIPWRGGAFEVHNRIRALSPYRAAWTELRKRRLKIYRSEVLAPATDSGGAAGGCASAPGKILRAEGGVLAICCGKGEALSLLEVQLEGKKRLSAKEFLKGAGLRAGDRLL